MAVNLDAPSRWPRAEFLADLRKAAKSGAGKRTGGGSAPPRDRQPQATASIPTTERHIDLAPEEVRILQVLARAHNEGTEEVPAVVLPEAAKLQAALFTYYADRLYRLGLIHVSVWSGGKDYKIKPPGIGWLLEHRALPE